MRLQSSATFLLLLPLCASVGCDVEEPMLDDDEIEERTAIGDLVKPYHGRWEGPMTNVTGNPNLQYDATIVLKPGICLLQPGQQSYTAEWDYYNLGVVCTSSLDFLGTWMTPNGSRGWTFYDHSLSGGCEDGFVDLVETPDPDVLAHTWRWPSGNVDAYGLVSRNGLCSPGFGGGE